MLECGTRSHRDRGTGARDESDASGLVSLELQYIGQLACPRGYQSSLNGSRHSFTIVKAFSFVCAL